MKKTRSANKYGPYDLEVDVSNGVRLRVIRDQVGDDHLVDVLFQYIELNESVLNHPIDREDCLFYDQDDIDIINECNQPEFDQLIG